MKIACMIVGGVLGLCLLSVLWALRLAGWLAAMACGGMLLLAVGLAGTPAMWTLLDNAALCFAMVCITEMLPLLFQSRV